VRRYCETLSSNASYGTARRRVLPFVLALAIVLADRWSKISIRQSMTSFDSVSIVPGWLRIIHTENPGAAFGILAEGNTWLRSSILIGVSALVLVFVISSLWGSRSSFTGVLARTALALILGGALGNLYDRVVRGRVTDFIEVYHGSWSFPAFNVADSAITVGAILLLVELLFTRRKPAALAHN
jgi:signal peptidase II